MDWKELYKQAVILDTETMGLARGSGMHEVSLYNVARKEISQYLLAPNATIVTPANQGQDFVQFSTRPSDRHAVHPSLAKLGSDATWADAVKAQLLMDKGRESKELLGLTISEIRGMSDDELRQEMSKRMPKIKKWIEEGKYPWLADLAKKVSNNPAAVIENQWDEKKALAEARKLGIDVEKFNISRVTEQELLGEGSSFVRKLNEGAIWIANANFESKQIGAKIAAQEQAIRDEMASGKISREMGLKKLREQTALRRVINEVPTDIADVFNVTGKEVNLARYRGYLTGDWRDTYRAIAANTRVGDVRDIIDVVRAQQSFSQKLGILQGTAPSQLSMDVQARLYGFSTARSADEAFKHLTTAELHAAWADASGTEAMVLKQSLRQTDALDQVERRTARGLELIEEAKRGTGAYYDALRYASAKQALDASLQEGPVRQNLARAALQLLEEDKTYQSAGHKLSSNTRVMKSGLIEKVPYPRPMPRREFTNLEKVVEAVAKRPDYQASDVAAIYGKMEQEFIEKGFIDANNKTAIAENLDSYKTHLRSLIEGGSEHIDEHFRKVADTIGDSPAAKAAYIKSLEGGIEGGVKTGEYKALGSVNWKAMDVTKGKILRYGGLFAAGITLMGAVAGQRHSVRRQREGPESARSMNYEKWLSLQQNFAGLEQATNSQSGFQEQGVGAAYRHQMTDFGSPYQGPIASDYIFQHQKLLEARERFNRQAFGARHYDPQSTIGNYMASFGFGAGGRVGRALQGFRSHYNRYDVPAAGHYVDTQGYEGLSRGNLLKLDLSRYKISAEDADTITLKKKGVLNSLSYFFGASAPMSIRMAGIDAPETAHGGRGAMPLAENSKVALEAMLAGGSNIELLVDPTNMTYGRTVGFAFADGQNINLELLRQGHVAYLPFRGGKKNYYNPAIFSRTQKLAQGSEKQMWGQGYYQAYRDVVAASGSTITFNTLVNPEKVAKSASLMSTSALMRSAGDLGMYTPGMAMEAAQIGDRLKASNFKDDYKRPILFNHRNMAGNSQLEQLKFEAGELMATREGPLKNKMSRKTGYGNLDKALVLDSIGSTTSIFNKRRLSTYDTYGAERKERMRQESANLQRIQLKQMFQSPIGHYRM